MVAPRVYECGHSVCEFCMMQSDLVAAEEAALNTLPLYRCPECRCGTLLPCKERPVNHALSRLLRLEEGYAEREAQVDKDMAEWLDAEDTDDEEEDAAGGKGGARGGREGDGSPAYPPNLAALSSRVRHRRAATLFRRLMPSLAAAAHRGAARLVVTTRARELSEMAKEISAMLFGHGVHSVVAHPREFCVNIIREDGRHSWGSGEFVNERYEEPPPSETPSSPESDGAAAPRSRIASLSETRPP